jgi:formylglycine-generating enzyme required for sulfatase activity
VSKPASSTLHPALTFALSVVISALVAAAVVKAIRGAFTPKPAPSAGTSRPAAPGSQPSPAASAAVPPPRPALLDESPTELLAQREVLFKNLQSQLGLSDEALSKTREIFADSRWMGQGNPKITKHPMTRAECLAIRQQHEFRSGDARCGAPNMVTVFDPAAGETRETAKLCIDQYEYPNIACDYPVTWVKSDQAENLCKAQGKRLCDAHEWEGACAGALHTPERDYTFGERRLMQEYLHNKSREIVWAYGKKKNHALCGTGSSKSPKCFTPSWELCGSNTYPAGAFPECVSSFGVYDQHGNAAEHMNLPLVAEELGSRGGTGENEMKGSWFIFQQADAHEDDCRWRALAWHEGKLMADDAHRNYHLGFRCCKDL